MSSRSQVLNNSSLAEHSISFVEGGKRRQDSVRLALQSFAKDSPPDYVGIHDAARPFVSKSLIQQAFAYAQKYGAALPGIRSTETLKFVDENALVKQTLDRDRIFRVQTHQVFATREILEAHLHFEDSDEKFTDDAALYERLGKKCFVFEGEMQNIKVTTPDDLKLLGIAWSPNA